MKYLNPKRISNKLEEVTPYLGNNVKSCKDKKETVNVGLYPQHDIVFIIHHMNAFYTLYKHIIIVNKQKRNAYKQHL